NHSDTRVSIQLHAALQCLGFYGNASGIEIIADRNAHSTGFIKKALERVCNAFFSLRDKVIIWPTSKERKDLCEYSRIRHGFPGCFFVVDGTTHPLANAPSLEDKESFYDRKPRYSIHGMIASDVRKKVINAIVGWSGSTTQEYCLPRIILSARGKRRVCTFQRISLAWEMLCVELQLV
ncbi:MAG: hypothetical protein AAF599_13085, partial [Bacteroidota bacterium]